MQASPHVLHWRKSSRSGGQNNCVEIARLGSDVAVRDSKNPQVRPVTMSPPTWRAVIGQIKNGQFDL